jgi:hypothetical protein
VSLQRVRVVPLNLDHSNQGLQRFLGRLSPFWAGCPGAVLDFTECNFLSAVGAAILAAFALKRESEGGYTLVDWSTVDGKLLKQLGRWNLNELFGRENLPWTDNAIPLLHQHKLDGANVIGYISTVLRSGHNMPSMTDDLVKRTNGSLCELFLNVFQHSESACGGIAIGQFYPIKKQVQFCVCDGGVGLVKKVHKAGFVQQSGWAAIRWALNEGTSTKSATDGPPGGLGLYILEEFVKKNGGSLRIIANDAYYDRRGLADAAGALDAPYPGTLVQVSLLIRENEVYTIQKG